MAIFKTFSKMLMALAFLINTSNVIGAATGPDDWRDNAGQLAPASVRQAADNLWAAVNLEGAASWNAGWCVRKKLPPTFCCVLTRALLFLPAFGTLECELECNRTYNTPGNHAPWGNGKGVIWQQRAKEANEALQRFKDIVNRFVSNPEQYSGDAKICELGPMIIDNKYSSKENCVVNCELLSVSRDLKDIPRSVRAFVNTHGGWASEADVKETVVVPVIIPVTPVIIPD